MSELPQLLVFQGNLPRLRRLFLIRFSAMSAVAVVAAVVSILFWTRTELSLTVVVILEVVLFIFLAINSIVPLFVYLTMSDAKFEQILTVGQPPFVAMPIRWQYIGFDQEGLTYHGFKGDKQIVPWDRIKQLRICSYEEGSPQFRRRQGIQFGTPARLVGLELEIESPTENYRAFAVSDASPHTHRIGLQVIGGDFEIRKLKDALLEYPPKQKRQQ